MGEKKVVFLCTARVNSLSENDDLNASLAERIEKLGFQCIYAVRDTDQTMPKPHIHKVNINHIESSEIFIAVLKNYSKNLTFEVGYALALKRRLGKPQILLAIDFGETNPEDAMTIHSFDKIIKPEELEAELRRYTNA